MRLVLCRRRAFVAAVTGRSHARIVASATPFTMIPPLPAMACPWPLNRRNSPSSRWRVESREIFWRSSITNRAPLRRSCLPGGSPGPNGCTIRADAVAANALGQVRRAQRLVLADGVGKNRVILQRCVGSSPLARSVWECAALAALSRGEELGETDNLVRTESGAEVTAVQYASRISRRRELFRVFRVFVH